MSMRPLVSVLTLAALAAAAVSAAAPARSSQARWLLSDLGKDRNLLALNDHGQIVGYGLRSDGLWRALIWEQGQSRELGSLGAHLQTEPNAINNRGEIVGRAVRYEHIGIREPAVESYAFLWRNGRLLKLDGLGGKLTSAHEINDRGDILGESTPARGESHSVLWRNGQLIDLGSLTAVAFNNRGQVVGTDRTTGRAALWQNGRLRNLGTIGGSESDGVSINDRGQVLGESRHAFLWQNGRSIDLGTLGGTYSFAREINARGQVIGTSYIDRAGTEHPFFWQQGKMTDLGTLGGRSAVFAFGGGGRGRSLDDRGRAILNVTSFGNTYRMHAVVWAAGKTTALPTLGGLVTVAGAINNSGQIIGSSNTKAGSSNTPTGSPHGVIWTLRPGS